MQEIIQSFFRERSLVNHQIASYDDCIPAGDNAISRMEKIIRNIRVGTDEEISDDKNDFLKIVKNITSKGFVRSNYKKNLVDLSDIKINLKGKK